MSRSIPEVRKDLMKLAETISSASPAAFAQNKRVWAERIRRLSHDTKRKPPISAAPRRIRPLDDEARQAVRDAHRRDPTRSQLELAWLFNTNPGRISEALNEGTPNAA